jgi:hypothetical protein
MAKGDPVPPAATRLFAVPVLPTWAFRFANACWWRAQAIGKRTLFRLDERPYPVGGGPGRAGLVP